MSVFTVLWNRHKCPPSAVHKSSIYTHCKPHLPWMSWWVRLDQEVMRWALLRRGDIYKVSRIKGLSFHRLNLSQQLVRLYTSAEVQLDLAQMSHHRQCHTGNYTWWLTGDGGINTMDTGVRRVSSRVEGVSEECKKWQDAVLTSWLVKSFTVDWYLKSWSVDGWIRGQLQFHPVKSGGAEEAGPAAVTWNGVLRWGNTHQEALCPALPFLCRLAAPVDESFNVRARWRCRPSTNAQSQINMKGQSGHN